MKPAYTRISSTNIDGTPGDRLMVVLKTKGCEYARKSGGCPFCGFIKAENIKDAEIAEQLHQVIGSLNGHKVQEIGLLSPGSFLNDSEFSREVRKELLHTVAELKTVRRVTIESRSEYISPEKLEQCRCWLGDKTLEVAIGLESADDYIRNTVLCKNLSKPDFEHFVKTANSSGCEILAYLLIKPPGVSEKKAVEDAVRSAEYVFEVAEKYHAKARVAFQPVFITRNTRLEKLFLNKEYRLSSLWTVVEVIRRTHGYGTVFVGLSDEGLSMGRKPYSCDKCYETLVNEIERFNRSLDFSRLEHMDCECRQK